MWLGLLGPDRKLAAIEGLLVLEGAGFFEFRAFVGGAVFFEFFSEQSWSAFNLVGFNIVDVSDAKHFSQTLFPLEKDKAESSRSIRLLINYDPNVLDLAKGLKITLDLLFLSFLGKADDEQFPVLLVDYFLPGLFLSERLFDLDCFF